MFSWDEVFRHRWCHFKILSCFIDVSTLTTLARDLLASIRRLVCFSVMKPFQDRFSSEILETAAEFSCILRTVRCSHWRWEASQWHCFQGGPSEQNHQRGAVLCPASYCFPFYLPTYSSVSFRNAKWPFRKHTTLHQNSSLQSLLPSHSSLMSFKESFCHFHKSLVVVAGVAAFHSLQHAAGKQKSLNEQRNWTALLSNPFPQLAKGNKPRKKKTKHLFLFVISSLFLNKHNLFCPHRDAGLHLPRWLLPHHPSFPQGAGLKIPGGQGHHGTGLNVLLGLPAGHV